MKSLIEKRTERHANGHMERVVVKVFGLCIYMHIYPIDSDTKPRNVGFIQYHSAAPVEVEDNDYFPDEEI